MGDSDHLRYLMITVAIYFSLGNCSTDSRLRFERLPEGVDYDDSYRIEVTQGQEVISSTLTHGGHYRAITVTVSAFNDIFVLDLHLNTYLFAAGYVERSFSKDGVVYHDVNHTEGHCYYLGKVRDQPQSTAAVSTCKGIVGYFTIGNISYHIDPTSNELHGPHKVYRSRGDSKTVYRCGHDDVSLVSLLNPAKHTRRLKRFIWPQDLDMKNKVVELYVANDYSQYLAKGSSVNAVIQRTKDIVNIASAGYQPLGIYIVLVGVEVWDMGDKITVNTSDKDSTLREWAYYRMANINPIHYNDNGVLITNNTFGNATGYAYIGRMCKNRLSAAFVADVHPLPYVAASIMDHEMGHNFGLIHDTEVIPDCPCSEPNRNCVMYPSVNSANPSFTWSQCSKDQFATSFRQGLDICLYNVPETIQLNNAFCGNGIVENDEQCDCGNSTEQECNKTCCDSTTCQLVDPATCAYGRCCNTSTCQILPCGTLCRGKADLSCDLDEVCDGLNHLCSNDTYLPDGTNCTVNGDSAYCYEGRCRSHNSQCKLIWAPGNPVANAICYTTFNDDGQHYGNCGVRWLPNVTYIPCPKSDVMCGKLQCENNHRNLSYYKSYFLISTVNTRGYNCLSIIFDFGLKTQDPGLVPNGAKCGDQKMCVNQRCLDVSSFNKTSCTSSCQPNEVCNNLGECQGNIGSCPQSTTTPPTTTTPLPVTSTQAPVASTPTPTTNTPTPTPSRPNPTTSSPISTTSKPIPTTSSPIPTTSKPIPTTSRPIPTSKPIPTTSSPIPTTSRPSPTTIKPIPTTSRPILTTSSPIPTTNRPTPTTSKPIPTSSSTTSMTSKPNPTTSRPIPTTSRPTPTTSRPTPTTNKPSTTTIRPIPTTSKPIPTPSRPIPTTSSPIHTTSRPTPTTTIPTPTSSMTTLPTTVLTSTKRSLALTTSTSTPEAISRPLIATSTPIPTITPISTSSTPIYTTGASILTTRTPKPTPSTSTPTTPITTMQLPATSTPKETTTANVITVVVVLATILGALALVMTTVLLLFCFYRFCPGALNSFYHLFVIAGPTTARAPTEFVTTPVFTRRAMLPVQSRLRWIPAKQFYFPQREIYKAVTPPTEYLQPDWTVLRRTRQPFRRGYQYANVLYPQVQPYSSVYNM